MPRVRVSTTVDADVLAKARALDPSANDAQLIEGALRALLARHRAAEIDASFAIYDEIPLSEPDEWGDLESFHKARKRA